MKTVIFILSLSLCTMGYAQQQYQYTTSADINKVSNIVLTNDTTPKEVVDLALYPDKNTDFKNALLKNPNTTYHYNGKDYYIRPIESGYIMHTSKKDRSPSVMYLKKVGHGNGYLFIDDDGNSSYANFDKKSNLIIEFYDQKTKKVQQLKITPRIDKRY